MILEVTKLISQYRITYDWRFIYKALNIPQISLNKVKGEGRETNYHWL